MIFFYSLSIYTKCQNSQNRSNFALVYEIISILVATPLPSLPATQTQSYAPPQGTCM